MIDSRRFPPTGVSPSLPKARAASGPVVGRIAASGPQTHPRITGGRKATMKVPLRSLSNVRHTPRRGHFEKAIDRYLPEKLEQPGNP
jgi:hypothetical protein